MDNPLLDTLVRGWRSLCTVYVFYMPTVAFFVILVSVDGNPYVGGRRSVFGSFFCFCFLSTLVYRMHVLCSWRHRSRGVIICCRSCVYARIAVCIQDLCGQSSGFVCRKSNYSNYYYLYVHIRELPSFLVCVSLGSRLLLVKNHCCQLSHTILIKIVPLTGRYVVVSVDEMDPFSDTSTSCRFCTVTTQFSRLLISK